MTKYALAVAAAVTCLALTGCSASVEPSERVSTTSAISATELAPTLLSVNNFRDVAGPSGGYVTQSGSRLKPGVIYRSNVLSPDDHDFETLNSLGLDKVYDLRMTSEVEATPDRIPLGAEYVRVDIMGDGARVATSTDIATMDGAKSVGMNAYRDFVTEAAQRQAFATLLTDLANDDGSQVFHCTAGKDRTGWAAALLQSIAGVPRDVVFSDYELTNEYTEDYIDATAKEVGLAQGDEAADAIRYVYAARPEFLQASFDEVDRLYGSLDGYLTNGLGLDSSTLSQLRSKLTAQ
ncbi:tyrosine-protein phosphatase [Rhodococcus sp. (in: high G+C Gram-positive bacteria)]|uniref:tyrosine-protein phosphatase n=1 Tax=Rhodococcus sp. TaxID=1831 RepID=UPI00257A3FA9|nr:tyrosine-protein phosphatase [Rhodococcus sp. (in: high G+C Gram-positive bacteria)]MBQ9052624.1 tyrosine-protein phosphatase [Rhodococcus sp. (in: high G+C Gram-positive bacteria)]